MKPITKMLLPVTAVILAATCAYAQKANDVYTKMQDESFFVETCAALKTALAEENNKICLDAKCDVTKNSKTNIGKWIDTKFADEAKVQIYDITTKDKIATFLNKNADLMQNKNYWDNAIFKEEFENIKKIKIVQIPFTKKYIYHTKSARTFSGSKSERSFSFPDTATEITVTFENGSVLKSKDITKSQIKKNGLKQPEISEYNFKTETTQKIATRESETGYVHTIYRHPAPKKSPEEIAEKLNITHLHQD